MSQEVTSDEQQGMIRRALAILKKRGVNVLVRAATLRVRGMLASRAKSFQTHQHLFIGKSGIEIGGPSAAFARGGIFPVYPVVRTLDNCNYSDSTAWDAGIDSGTAFRYDRNQPDGRQYIAEATALNALPSNGYDFVLSSHMLEHTANPILALSEWKRLLKGQGVLVLILPNKQYTFDHLRPTTTLAHLIQDFNAGVAEDDMTHLEEVLAFHDLGRDPDAGDAADFQNRCKDNVQNRCLHHHVFDVELTMALLEYVGFQWKSVEVIAPYHILALAQVK